MRKATTASRLLAAAMLLVSGTLLTAGEPQQVTIETARGETLRGFIDSRTDEQLVWIRNDSPGISLSLSIPWEQIVSASHGGRAMSATELAGLADQLASPAGELIPPAAEGPPTLSRSSGEPNRGVGRAASIWVESQPANWDRDAEVDGLELRLRVLAADRRLVPVRGQLGVKLLATHYGGTWERVPRDADLDFELARWSVLVKVADFGEDGAVYRLPYRGNFRIAATTRPVARIHAQLAVFGQGSFAAENYLEIVDRAWLPRIFWQPPNRAPLAVHTTGRPME